MATLPRHAGDAERSDFTPEARVTRGVCLTCTTARHRRTWCAGSRLHPGGRVQERTDFAHPVNVAREKGTPVTAAIRPSLRVPRCPGRHDDRCDRRLPPHEALLDGVRARHGPHRIGGIGIAVRHRPHPLWVGSARQLDLRTSSCYQPPATDRHHMEAVDDRSPDARASGRAPDPNAEPGRLTITRRGQLLWVEPLTAVTRTRQLLS